ncbi:hypothetical protein NC652_002401 [Populus alba x Populus x berolinensis]|uniref:Uncharacterized protein n=1 Tax=Populus alba x Populus x berolinensis TaxID=444605 RepID=A0AAD6WGW1_9ROSI|nr:hypothetical protein NC652_002401 [Populus alba x Populus x berolinensis]KAJ7012428.1 hypothetical protein NC653_002469 [Populus alba x Populus x berolinensis]
MEGDVSSDDGAILESAGRVSRLTSLATVMHAGLPKMLASTSYKSQGRSRTKKERRKETGNREGEERKKERDRGNERGERRTEERTQWKI